MGLILALDRRIPDNVAELRAGTWNKKEYSKAQGPDGPDARPARLRPHRPRGRDARRARSGCRSSCGAAASAPMPKHARPPRKNTASRSSTRPTSSLAQSDVVSVHLALRRTRRVRQRGPADARKAGAFFINTARGEVVDYAALAEAVKDEEHARRARRVRGRAVQRVGDVRRRFSAARRSTARTTSAPRPTRRRKRSPTRRCGSSARTRTPAGSRTLSLS